MNRLRRWWPLLVLALAPVWPLWRVIFLGQAIGPWEHIRAMAPWNGPPATQPWDVLQADGVLQFAPWRHMVLDAWGRGQMPFWNPRQLMGTPLLANSQSAGFYPPHIILGMLKVSVFPAMALLAWLHLFWAGLGAYKLSRRLGASRIGGTIGGVSFALSPFMLAWTPLPSVISTVAWLPWCFFFLMHPARRSTAGLSVCIAMMVLAGHLQFVAYGLMAIVLAALVLAIRGERKRLASILAALVVGFCLAAPQLIPVLSFSRSSHRQSGPSAAGYEAYLGGAVSPFQLSGAVYPSVLGHPSEGSELIPGANTYWPALSKPGADFAESAITIGPLVLALLVLFRPNDWREPGRLAMAAVAVLGLLVALGTPFNALLYYGVPGWSATGSPGRASVLFVLASCALAGIGATRLSELPQRASMTPRVAVLAAGLLTAALPMIFIGSLGDPYRLGPALATAVSSALMRAFPWILCSLVAAAAVLFVRPVGAARRGIVLALGVLMPVLLLHGTTPILTGRPIDVHPETSTDRIAVINRSWELVTSRPALLPPNTGGLIGLVDVAGYDSLVDRETKQQLDGVNGQDSAPPTNGNMMFVKPAADWARLRELGVSQVWSTAPLPGLPSQVVPQSGVYRYVLGGPGRSNSFVMPGVVTLDGYDRTEVKVYGGAPLILRDRNLPGWRALVDGKPAVIEAAGPFRKVKLQRGEHTVVFHYWPPGLTPGLWLFGLGSLALVAMLLPSRRAKNVC